MIPTDRQWQALVARDPANAGPVYYAVRTTGVYCRPGCPARTPLRRNVEIFDATAAAEAAGYRPCKRCRPQGVMAGASWPGRDGGRDGGRATEID